jgi:hypothetical protein
MGTDKTGWEPENRKHFDEIVEAYDKRRSEYPFELFEDIIEYSGAVNDFNSHGIKDVGLIPCPITEACPKTIDLLCLRG